MVLKQRLQDGKTQFIDIGDNFLVITPYSKEWNPTQSKDIHSVISYCDYEGKLQHEPLYKDFFQWIYSNDGQLFLTLNNTVADVSKF